MISTTNITTWCAAGEGCMAAVAIKAIERASTGLFVLEDEDCF